MTDSGLLDKKLGVEDGGAGRKSKKKPKGEDAWRPLGPRDPFAMLDALPEKKQQEIQKALHLFALGPSPPRSLQEAERHTYRFWDTQPVRRLKDNATTHGPIVESEAGVREDPYSLPQGFFWDTLDLNSSSVLQELCALLNDNYTEDDDNTFRHDFSPEYLQWTLQPPNWLTQWHCGVRVSANKKLVGFIAAAPAHVRVYETQRQMVHVKFLCVHKKLRLKRMTPVLIREVTRRVNQQGLCQAVFTAGVVLPAPLSSCRIRERPLNVQKLMEVNYPGLKPDVSLQRALRFNRLPEATKTGGLRPMRRADVVATHSLLQDNNARFHISPVFSPHDVEHWFLPRENVIYTYVVEDDDGKVTDMVSFYGTAFRVLNHPIHTDLRAAHLLCAVSSVPEPTDLIEDAMVLARAKGFDVFTALNVMGNTTFLTKLKFSDSEISLHYYLYNWQCPDISPDKVGIVLPS